MSNEATSRDPNAIINYYKTIFPVVPATATHPKDATEVLSKDITVNPSNQTWARVFLPKQALDDTNDNIANKLPIVVYFHGGGFIICSVASSIFHDFCSNMVLELPTIVVSVEYRKAPEHRLPAAYDDAVEALRWIRNSDDVWLRKYGDYSRCYLMGTSAGGNIAYHAGLLVAGVDLEPLKIKGLILHQPFFGGTRRTESELKLVDDPILAPGVTDIMWDQSLPLGADRDHEYANPTVGGRSRILDQIKGLGWKVLVTACDGDPLIDNQRMAFELMESKGVKVEGYFVKGGYHIMDMEPSKGQELFAALKNFIC